MIKHVIHVKEETVFFLSDFFSMNVQGPGLEWVVHCGGDGRSPYPVLRNHLTFPGLEETAGSSQYSKAVPNISRPRTETGWKAIEMSSVFREAHAVAKYTQNQN